MNYLKNRKKIESMAFDLNKRPNYDYYIISLSEKIIYSLAGIFVLFLIGYTFYKNIFISMFLAAFGLFLPYLMYPYFVKKRKRELNLQFKDLLYSISSGLSAGKSPEMTFREAQQEMKLLYPLPNTDIIKEIGFINTGLAMNETLEKLLYDFGMRSKDEDIMSFAEVFISCKRTGGNLIEAIRIASNVISDKIEIKREIEVSLSEKKFEQKAMCALMIILVLALSYFSGGYMDSMFTTLKGRIIMTLALILFAVSYAAGAKIMDIEV